MKKKILMAFCLVIAFMLCGCSSLGVSISQSQSKIEIGMGNNALNYVTFDTSKYSVRVVDAGGFNTNKLGDYQVTYSVTNLNNNKTIEKIFNFSVVDTKCPTIISTPEVIYLAKNNTYDIKKYIECQDNSGDYNVEVNGYLNVGKEGEYLITAIISDDSGNSCQTNQIKVVVEDRSNCDFKLARFGDDIETVKRYEDSKKLLETYNQLTYQSEVDGNDANLVYYFNSKGQLYAIMCYFINTYTDGNKYINSYLNMQGFLVGKYGKPKSNKEIKGNLYGYCNSKGQALMIGAYSAVTTWNLSNMDVKLGLTVVNKNPVLAITYASKKYS